MGDQVNIPIKRYLMDENNKAIKIEQNFQISIFDVTKPKGAEIMIEEVSK